SRDIMISDPSASCISMALCGVRKCLDPSIWDWNMTPSGPILRSALRE
ncbi:MAG: hypothetical protein H6Q49_1869, partial [Deltaproteobacteria bacterium]|nr:hypothetical protein [Deltaproteobacteria bacterium]